MDEIFTEEANQTIDTLETIFSLNDSPENNFISRLPFRANINSSYSINSSTDLFVKYFINEYQKINNLTQTEITSPTFSLLNEYQVKDIRIKHYDLFRINRKEDINNLDIFEKDNKLITLIEWPQLIADKQDIKFITLTFNYLNQLNDRTVDIKV